MLNICFQCKCTNHGDDTNLLLQLVEDELHHHIVLHLQHLVDPLGDPGLQNVHLDFGHVDLLNEIILKLHSFQQFLLLVRKAIVLIRTGALRKRNVNVNIADLCFFHLLLGRIQHQPCCQAAQLNSCLKLGFIYQLRAPG